MPVRKPAPGELEGIETASRDELQALQWRRLKWTLRHAYDNVAHYRAAFDAASVRPDDLRTLDDLANSFAEAPERIVIRMIGDGPPLVLDRNKVEAARERIKTRYNVLKEQNLEEQPGSNTPKQANKI